MIRNPVDISSRVSPELSSLIESVINQLETDELITLGTVREFISHDLPEEMSEAEEMHHFDNQESLVDELDGLIEGFGESAPAINFACANASEPLSRVIEAVMDDENRENPPTLDAIRAAIIAGISSRLVGEGVMDEEEDDLLLPEIDNLIEHYGADALAEDFLRYE